MASSISVDTSRVRSWNASGTDRLPPVRSLTNRRWASRRLIWREYVGHGMSSGSRATTRRSSSVSTVPSEGLRGFSGIT